MGDRYEWMDKCPNCGYQIRCYYADSCGISEVKCSMCKKQYEIILDFKLVEKKSTKIKINKLQDTALYASLRR